jgi:hypothetical protein
MKQHKFCRRSRRPSIARRQVLLRSLYLSWRVSVAFDPAYIIRRGDCHCIDDDLIINNKGVENATCEIEEADVDEK